MFSKQKKVCKNFIKYVCINQHESSLKSKLRTESNLSILTICIMLEILFKNIII